MMVMALDHVRDFFGVPGVSPTDPARAGAALFFTRWITHVCAPVFFLLAGTGAYLSLRRKSVSDLSRFLFTRGLWLIVLELTLVRCLGFQFNVDYRVTMLLVLWALGWAMITLSALRAADRVTPPWLRPARVVGRVPMFYFVLHLPLIHLLAIAVSYGRYHDAHWMFESPDLAHYPFSAPPGWGFPLPMVYAIWIAVVLALYPACRWFADLKQRRTSGWLSYL